MGLEAATYIHQLNPSNPVGAVDPKAQGDDHLRMIKSTIQATFAGIAGPVTVTHTQLNNLAAMGLTGFAAPTVAVGPAGAAAGVATTALRSDAKLVIDLTAGYNWTNNHSITHAAPALTFNSTGGGATYILMSLSGVPKVRFGAEGATGGAITGSSIGDAIVWSASGVTFSGNSGGFGMRLNGTSGALELGGGAAGTPVIARNGTPTTGLYFPSTTSMAFSRSGTPIAGFGLTYASGVGSIAAAAQSVAEYAANLQAAGSAASGGNTCLRLASSAAARATNIVFTDGAVWNSWIEANSDGSFSFSCSGSGVWAERMKIETDGRVKVVDYGGTLQVVGFRNIPQNIQNANYTALLADSGKHVLHGNGAGAGHTHTIPANASVAYDIGTAITFINRDSNVISIAITTDTMILANTVLTGTRTLAANGIATAIKVAATTWMISGTGIS